MHRVVLQRISMSTKNISSFEQNLIGGLRFDSKHKSGREDVWSRRNLTFEYYLEDSTANQPFDLFVHSFSHAESFARRLYDLITFVKWTGTVPCDVYTSSRMFVPLIVFFFIVVLFAYCGGVSLTQPLLLN